MLNVGHNCKEELKEFNLKVTPKRVAILKLFESLDVPLDISEVHSNLVEQGYALDSATVFRIVNLFTDLGIVREVNFNEGKKRYELASKNDHHHLVCESCGNVEDITDCNIPDLEKEIKNKKNFLVKTHSLEFFGVCRACSYLDDSISGR